MSRFFLIFAAVLLNSDFWLLNSSAQRLPTFEDFRRADRERRETGQRQTTELLELTRIDRRLIERVTQQATNDYQLVWGAAELIGDWQTKRALFESALMASRTNVAVMLRYACATAQNRDFELAHAWIKRCQQREADNVVPWLVELWALREQNIPVGALNPPERATQFRDYGTEAVRARIRLLEAAGYSPFSARRLGFPLLDVPAVSMARDLAGRPLAKGEAHLLMTVAKAMQQGTQFQLTEFVGQTLERAVLVSRPDAANSAEVPLRFEQIEERREEMDSLRAYVERNVMDIVTEAQMVRYFDDVLTIGEEAAMKKLAEAVRKIPVK